MPDAEPIAHPSPDRPDGVLPAGGARPRASKSGGPRPGRPVVLTTGHSLLDDRVYYKEVRSLARCLGPIDFLAPWSGELPADVAPGVTVHRLGAGAGLIRRLARLPGALVRLRRLKPSTVHFHDPECLLLAPLLRILGDSRLIYDCHEVYPETILGSERYPNFLRPALAKTADIVERVLARSLHAVIGTDPDVVARFSGTRAVKEVVYNFPPLDVFPWPAPKGIPEDERPVLLYQGGMSEDRGLYVMIEAMSFVKTARPDALLRLVGPMAVGLRKEADRLIASLGLADAVEIRPPVPHTSIPAIVAAATIGLVPFKLTPKWTKNVPIKQFEYMACGVPVVASDVPPVARFVKPANAGLLVAPGDPGSLAEGVLELLGDADRRREMGLSGRRWVDEEWNWARMEQRLVSVYERLLG